MTRCVPSRTTEPGEHRRGPTDRQPVRRQVRGRFRRPRGAALLARAGARQPHRRAHRLQRRLRHAHGRRPRGARLLPPAAGRAGPHLVRELRRVGRVRPRRRAPQPDPGVGQLHPRRRRHAPGRRLRAEAHRGHRLRRPAHRRRPQLLGRHRGGHRARVLHGVRASRSTRASWPCSASRPRTASSASTAASWTSSSASTRKAQHALLLDCRSLEHEQAPLDTSAVRVVVCNTMVHHELGSSGYNERRASCESAARRLGVELLRDVTPAGAGGEGGRPRPRHPQARPPRRQRGRAHHARRPGARRRATTPSSAG